MGMPVAELCDDGMLQEGRSVGTGHPSVERIDRMVPSGCRGRVLAAEDVLKVLHWCRASRAGRVRTIPPAEKSVVGWALVRQGFDRPAQPVASRKRGNDPCGISPAPSGRRHRLTAANPSETTYCPSRTCCTGGLFLHTHLNNGYDT